MSYGAPISARISHKMWRGAVSQPIGAVLALVACLLIGAPAWVIVLQGAWAIVVTAILVREKRELGMLRPPVFFLVMTTGVCLGFLSFGGLRSPLAFPLATLSAGAAGMAPDDRVARRVIIVLFAMMALGVIFELAGLPLASSPAAFDREAPGAGFYVGTALTFVGLAVGAGFGGMAARELRLALDETEAVEALARGEHVASIEARSRDVMLLTGALARELSEPLDSVRRRAKTIAERTQNAAMLERLAVLGGEVDRVERRLAHYLTFSRSSNAAEVVRIAELLAALARASDGLAASRKVTIELAVEPPELEISTDHEKLVEVLENLAQNAIEASPEGGRVVIAARSAGGGGIEIEVLDEGSGLDAEVAKRVFSAGFTTKARGSGLGLVLSQRIADQLGGALSLENRSTRGCRALVVLGGRRSG